MVSGNVFNRLMRKIRVKLAMPPMNYIIIVMKSGRKSILQKIGTYYH
jgi:hypothetical protein